MRGLAMETVKLRNLQQPSDVEQLLETYIAGSGLLPGGAYRVLQRADVPRELRRIQALATRTGQSWSCWTHKFHTWLFTAEMSLPLSRERGIPVLQVSQWSDDGILQASGCWMADKQGKQHRCED
jgi:hypothetical protein